MKFKKFFLLLVVIALLPYLNIFQNDFVGYDDQNLIQNNRQIRSLAPENVARMFIPKLRGNYQPVRTLSYALDYAVWGPRPFGFHLTNILLHVFTVVMVWLLLRRLLKEPAPFLAALLFAVHPIHVESVTWMSSRKDVLSLSFFLLAILLYDDSEARGNRAMYAASIVAAALALLSKLTAVTLPFCILLLQVCRDGWPNRAEWMRKAVRLSPHLLLVLIIILLNFLRFGVTSTHGDALAGMETASMAVLRDIRLSMPLIVWRYIGLLLAPYHLITHYAIIRITTFSDPRFWIPLLLLLSVAAVTVILFFRGRRAVAFCIAWFFVTFLPTANIVPTAAMMVDRYMHAPSIGILALLGMIMAYPFHAEIRERSPSFRRLAIIACAAIILFYGILTTRRNADWRTTYSLFSRTLAVNPQSVDARLALGTILEKEGMLDDAIEMYHKGLETSPGDYRVLYDLGVAYMKKGWYPQAVRALEDSRSANPQFLSTHYNLALAYSRMHRLEDAIAEYKAVLALNPRHASSLGALGRIYLERGNYELAMEHLNQALQYQPDLIPALLDRVELQTRLGHPELAAEDVKKLSSLGIDAARLLPGGASQK